MKKIVALAMSAAMTLSLAACGDDAGANSGTNAGTNSGVNAGANAGTNEVQDISLKVWCPEEEMEITQEMANSFQVAHPEYKITWDIAVVGVDESTANLSTDAESAADVFLMPSGSISELVEAGLLLPIAYDIENVKSLYGEGALQSCIRGDMMYGIPATPNSWFMYYNKSMYSEDEVKSLETMMAKDFGEGYYNFSCDLTNSWYLEAFFYAAGCQLYGPDGMDPNVCTWNDANGVAVGNYLIDLANNAKYIEDKDGIAGSLFKDGKLGSFCSGTWSAPDLKEALGDNLGAVALPTIQLNGKECQLSNFADYKCFSVKSSTAYPLAAQQFAEWLGNEENQLTRFKECAATPTCLSLASNSELAASVESVALLAQTKYATPQPSISQIAAYWVPVQALGEGIFDSKEITKDNIQDKLNTCAKAIVTPPVSE